MASSTITIPKIEYSRLQKLEHFIRSVPDIEELFEKLEDAEALGAKRLSQIIARARRERKMIPWSEVKRRLNL